MIDNIADIFSKNRAEEFPDDVWGAYVLPQDYLRADLTKLTKAAVVVGGRGSGKTMFIKYHCHPTRFSPLKSKIDLTAFNFIGIYWRPDTSFTRMISEAWLNDRWKSAFNTYASLCVLIEFSRLMVSVDSSSFPKNIKNEIKDINIPSPLLTALKIPADVQLINGEELFNNCLFELCNWINLPVVQYPPYNLDLKNTVNLVVNHLKKINKNFSNSLFHIFIDEFENLSSEQQPIINSLLKHGKPPLLFSVAYKKNAQVSIATTSQENIVERNDLRTIDLESIYLEETNSQSYEILAAEVLFLRLANYINDKAASKKLTESFSDIKSLSNRRQPAYREYILSNIKPIFPSIKPSKIAENLVNDVVTLRIVSNLIKDGLKFQNESEIDFSEYIDKDYPEATVINGVLLHRSSNSPKALLKEFELYKAGNSDKYKSWIQNNLYGVILLIYNSLSTRTCPLYAGFNQFVLMSKGNLRHFLELCYQTITRAEIEHDKKQNVNSGEKFVYPIEVQAKATKLTSSLELEKIEELGANGIHLKRFAKRIGIIFQMSQKRKSQSEPEVNHFSIALSDISLLGRDTKYLLNEALIWSVLFKRNSTKNKSETEIELVDYYLHPVLSCNFTISPRKKRKLRLSANEITTLFNGSEEKFNLLLTEYRTKWRLENQILVKASLSPSQTNMQFELYD